MPVSLLSWACGYSETKETTTTLKPFAANLVKPASGVAGNWSCRRGVVAAAAYRRTYGGGFDFCGCFIFEYAFPRGMLGAGASPQGSVCVHSVSNRHREADFSQGKETQG